MNKLTILERHKQTFWLKLNLPFKGQFRITLRTLRILRHKGKQIFPNTQKKLKII